MFREKDDEFVIAKKTQKVEGSRRENVMICSPRMTQSAITRGKIGGHSAEAGDLGDLKGKEHVQCFKH